MVRHTVRTHLVPRETIAAIPSARILLEQPAVAMALRTAEIHLEQPEIIGAILGAPTPSVQRVVVTEPFAVKTPSAPCAATEYITDRSCWPTNVLARTLLCPALYCFTEPVN